MAEALEKGKGNDKGKGQVMNEGLCTRYSNGLCSASPYKHKHV